MAISNYLLKEGVRRGERERDRQTDGYVGYE
jgi:hypothetical protein